ncbi:MAG: hypothetical protein J7M18_02750 [Candidatus Eremiobacteraeota bacterium]|nr:hypothetical protein [Candidatus Eremiobacteraeota bacterium]
MIGEAVLLEYKMAKGEELEYRSVVKSDQSVKEGDEVTSQVSELVMDMSQKALEVKPEGLMDIEVTITGGKTKVNEEESELPNVGQTILMTMKKNGEITKSSVDIPFSQPPFPSYQVKKGDSWKEQSRVSIPGKDEPAVLTYEYTLVGFADIANYKCVEISVKCNETKVELGEGADQTITAIGTTYFAPKEGRLVRSEVETVTKIIAENLQVDNKIKVTVELVGTKSAPFQTDDQGFIAR